MKIVINYGYSTQKVLIMVSIAIFSQSHSVQK